MLLKTLNFSIRSTKIADIGIIRLMFNMIKEINYHDYDYDKFYIVRQIYFPPLYVNVYEDVCCLWARLLKHDWEFLRVPPWEESTSVSPSHWGWTWSHGLLWPKEMCGSNKLPVPDLGLKRHCAFPPKLWENLDFFHERNMN